MVDGAGDDGLVGEGAFDGGEAEFEAFEIVSCTVSGLSFFFYGAEQLAHGSVKAVGEPGSFQFGGGDAVVGDDFDLLIVEVGAVAAKHSAAAADQDAVPTAVGDVGVEDEGSLGGGVFDGCLGDERGIDVLRG